MIHSICGIFAYVLAFICFGSGFAFKLKQYAPKDVDNDPPEDSGDSRENSSKMNCVIWGHWALGNLAYLFTVICVGVVGSMPMAQAPCFVEYFTYIHFALYLCAHFAMMVSTIFYADFLMLNHIFYQSLMLNVFSFRLIQETSQNYWRMTGFSTNVFLLVQ